LFHKHLESYHGSQGELTEQENKDIKLQVSDLPDFSVGFLRKLFCAEDHWPA